MKPELRAYGERACEGAPELTDQQVRQLAILLAPALRDAREGKR